MTDAESPTSIQPNQATVYRRYAQLQSMRAQRFPDISANGLAGLLLTCVGFGLEGAELALATTIAGGTFLGIDPSSEHLKIAVRNGSCDFMVNTLDESLRVLKNELRKKKALSVGLLADSAAILPAMIERGVQPDLVADSSASQRDTSHADLNALTEFIERGAVSVDAIAIQNSSVTGLLETAWTAPSIVDLRRMDQLAMQQIPAEDLIRRRWLQHAPGYFHRQRPLQRVLWMRSEEVARLAGEFKLAIAAGQIQSTVNLTRETPEGLRESIAL